MMDILQENSDATQQVICPKCENTSVSDDYICEHCGFPFLCDITPEGSTTDKGIRLHWRVILGLVAIMFWLTNGMFVHHGYNAYQGLTTTVVAQLSPERDSGIPITGPGTFVHRTQLTLALLKQRSPAFYFRVQQRITSIDYLAPAYLETSDGRHISLEHIGALASPATGQVRVLYSTAYPRGMGDIADYDVFSYAGVLIHELHHIELHASGSAPGGMEEEVLCEKAAMKCLDHMNAPGAVMVRYHLYLQNPEAKRYQGWYDWYNQW